MAVVSLPNLEGRPTDGAEARRTVIRHVPTVRQARIGERRVVRGGEGGGQRVGVESTPMARRSKLVRRDSVMGSGLRERVPGGNGILHGRGDGGRVCSAGLSVIPVPTKKGAARRPPRTIRLSRYVSSISPLSRRTRRRHPCSHYVPGNPRPRQSDIRCPASRYPDRRAGHSSCQTNSRHPPHPLSVP